MNKPVVEKVNVGIFLDSISIPNWIYLIIKNIINSKNSVLSLIIINKNPAQLKYKTIYNFFIKLDKRIIKIKQNALKTVSIANTVDKIPLIYVNTINSDLHYEIDESEFGKLEKYDLDILLCLANKELQGKILEISKCGVWAFEFQKKRLMTKQPDGLAEILNFQSTTCISLKDIRPDHTNYRFETFMQTYPFSILKNRNRLLWKSTTLVHQLLKNIYATKKKILPENSIQIKTEHEVIKSQNHFTFFKFLRFLFSLLNHWLYKLVFKEQWILLFKKSDKIEFDFSSFKKIIPPKDRFWADPHVFFRDNIHYVFVEELIFRKRQAHISVLTIDQNNKINKPVKILDKKYHLSYPYIFEWENNLYMIPETSGNNTVEVYICKEFPYKWQFHKYLMKDVNAGDVTLFYYSNKWWLFTNIAINKGYPNWDDLYLYYSDNPLSEEWISHPKNPIISDVRRSRPAGKIFKENGNMYRPSQDSSERYGYGININQIIKMNEKEYIEKRIKKIIPDWDKNIGRTHTINYDNHLTIADAKRKVFKYL